MQQVELPVTRINFGRGGNSDKLVGAGWSAAESGFRWMIDDVSEFWFDATGFERLVLTLDLHPYVGPLHPAQRVIIKVGGVEVFRSSLTERSSCEIRVPEHSGDAANRLLHVTIEHPDAISPMQSAGHDDRRRLALAIQEARIHGSPAVSSMAVPVTVTELSAPAVISAPARLSTVFVGNCQMGALCSLYRRIVSENCEHDVTYIASYNDATDESRHVVAEATVLVHQVLNFAPRIGDLATKAKVYFVPHASAAFLWPYAGNPHPLNRSEPLIEQSGPYNGELGDGFLNRLIAERVSAQLAVARYLAADSTIVNRASRMMELHIQKQRERDLACDMFVADYIESRLKSTNLFRSPNHPEPVMACWIASELFIRMGEDAAAVAKLVNTQPDALPATETPLHPAVVQHFGISYAPPNRRYRFFEEGGFTFIEYISRYMNYEWNADLAESLSMIRRRPSDSTIAALKAALVTAPRSSIGRMTLVETLGRLGRPEEALDYACQAVQLEPGNRSYVDQLKNLADRVGSKAAAGVSVNVE